MVPVIFLSRFFSFPLADRNLKSNAINLVEMGIHKKHVHIFNFFILGWRVYGLLAKGQSTEAQFIWRSMARTPAGISFFFLLSLCTSDYRCPLLFVDDINKSEARCNEEITQLLFSYS